MAATTRKEAPAPTKKAPPVIAPLMEKSVPRERIARRAFELWQERGGEHGCDQDDWLRAERELSAGRADH
jgi:hypothetical protein